MDPVRGFFPRRGAALGRAAKAPRTPIRGRRPSRTNARISEVVSPVDTAGTSSGERPSTTGWTTAEMSMTIFVGFLSCAIVLLVWILQASPDLLFG
jgi:hypothetical protein